MPELHACCGHCDQGDDFHVMWGRDTHDDPCPDGCNAEGETAAMTDDYMTVAEFAALPSDAQIAVWQAHAEKRIEAVPVGGIYRYRRDQVLALTAGLAGAETGEVAGD